MTCTDVIIGTRNLTDDWERLWQTVEAALVTNEASGAPQ
jgi:hypothetical protein